MRPKKTRTISFIPKCHCFTPVRDTGDTEEAEETITLGIDMLEAMRLVDIEGMNQENAAQSMNVSAPTLCRILSQGRRRTALALTQGTTIKIEGGTIMHGNSQHGHGFGRNQHNEQNSTVGKRHGQGKCGREGGGKGSCCTQDTQANNTDQQDGEPCSSSIRS